MAYEGAHSTTSVSMVSCALASTAVLAGVGIVVSRGSCQSHAALATQAMTSRPSSDPRFICVKHAAVCQGKRQMHDQGDQADTEWQGHSKAGEGTKKSAS